MVGYHIMVIPVMTTHLIIMLHHTMLHALQGQFTYKTLSVDYVHNYQTNDLINSLILSN